MGYSEIICNICGVSFNIGRIRKAGEPRSAGWGPYGRNHQVGGRGDEKCGRESGCQFTIRKIADYNIDYDFDEQGKLRLLDENKEAITVPKKREQTNLWFGDADDEMDEDYEYESEHEEDPLEYDSDAGDDGDRMDVDDDLAMRGSENTDEKQVDAPLPEEEDEKAWLKAFWRRTFDPYFAAQYESHYDHNEASLLDERMRNLVQVTDDSEYEQDPAFALFRNSVDEDPELTSESGSNLAFPLAYNEFVEHIAGPGCEGALSYCGQQGYSGHLISEKEARYALTSQCFIRKPSANSTWYTIGGNNENSWIDCVEPDDEDWELEGDFVLSGLSDHMPSRDMWSPTCYPSRHGIQVPHAENHLYYNTGESGDCAMPFHPYCLEVYKRATGFMTGNFADIQGLTDWWTFRSGSSDYGAQVDREARHCNKQWWEHKKGTEYLVANPLQADKLSEILQAATIPNEDAEFDHNADAFQTTMEQVAESHDDPFAALPFEIRIHILSELKSSDIASLRLSSKCFRQLPISFFHSLIMREMPYMWEAWGLPEHQHLQKRPFAAWAMTTQFELEKIGFTYWKAKRELEAYFNTIREEMPELIEQMADLKAAYNLRLREEEVSARKALHPVALSYSRTNWYKLYTLISRHWDELKCLQNRRRIWGDCEIIVNDTKALREKNLIPVHDLQGLIRGFWVKRRAERERQDAERAAARAAEREAEATATYTAQQSTS